ncbi:hypothetical protein Lnau_3077 [Legionella nautarum]|uniref:Uncharacterized protein n=1 Tax=Legionella nautarum TaxID=45070 RepID=A0A0W0WJE4_9GAMM|nr:DVU_2496 family lipoprotein [Legionella nautarum]KTD32166.1 hypothetical protein Lnau_3077 [Legionella nautarum]
MKYYPSFAVLILTFIISINCSATCKKVYTIGAYDEAFKNHITVTKLGPLSASEVPATLPKSFLEKDGSYGGGETFCSIEEACYALKSQLASGVLPKTEAWHIYILDAVWSYDTYELHTNDYRLNRPVKVLQSVRESC